jgi:hypothetical protein
MLFRPLCAPVLNDPCRSPLSSEELYAARRAAKAVTRAARAGDAESRAALFAELQSVLADVRRRRGDHPILWELEADFTPDPAVAADLYLRAERAAAAAGLPTLSIRLSLARLLLKELGCPGEAREALLACEGELPQANEKQAVAWDELLAACERTLGSLTP